MSEIFYVMGYGRSGSTFYEAFLQSKGNLTAFGEVKYLAERGLLKNEKCGCGEPAKSCVFWKRVLDEIGQWDFAEISRVTNKLESSKLFFFNLWRARRGKLKDEIALYQSFNDKLYEVLSADGGFIDSSKMPARVFFLSYKRDSPFTKIVWFVRDPRGVAWSCMKDVDRHEAVSPNDSKMPRWGYTTSLIKWIINTHISRYVADQYESIVDIKRYEDLSSETMTFNPTNNGDVSSTTVIHSISGNPRRLTGGLRVFRLDDAWEKGLSSWKKILGKILCTPALRSIQKFECFKNVEKF